MKDEMTEKSLQAKQLNNPLKILAVYIVPLASKPPLINSTLPVYHKALFNRL